MNKAISNGISFLSHDAEKQLRHVRRLEVIRKVQARQSEDRPSKPARLNVVLPPDAAISAEAKAAVAKLDEIAAAAEAEAESAAADGPAAGSGAVADSYDVSKTPDIEWLNATCAAIQEWTAKVNSDASWASSCGGVGLDIEAFPSSYLGNGNGAGAAASSSPSTLEFPYRILPPCNSWRRRIIYSLVQGLFGTGKSSSVHLTVRPGDQLAGDSWDKRMRLTWVGGGTPGFDAFMACSLRRSLIEVDAMIDAAVGFRKVIDAITQAKVPVVGHNCYLDLAHAASKFSGPLPSNMCDWAAQLSQLFPGGVFDTKHMLQAGEVDAAVAEAFRRDNGLGQAYAVVAGQSTVMVPKAPAAGPSSSTAASGSTPAVTPAATPAPATVAADSTSTASAAPVVSDASAASSSSSAAPALAPASHDDAAAAAATPPTPAPAPAPQQQRTGAKRRWNDKPQVEMEAVTIDWPATVNVQLADGFAYVKPSGASNGSASSPSVVAAAASASASVVAPAAAAVGDGAVALTPPPVEIAAVAEDFAHDAGYDAHMTGTVFARVAVRIAEKAVSGTTTAARANQLFGPGRDLSPLSSIADRLFVMRVTDTRLKCMNLRHAKELALAGRQRDTAPKADSDADKRNSVLVGRSAADRSKHLHVSGLDFSIRSETLVPLLASTLGIDAKLIDTNKQVWWVDDSTAFVQLPSAAHVDEVLRAAAAEEEDGSEDGGAATDANGDVVMSEADGAAANRAATPTSSNGSSGGGGKGIIGWILEKLSPSGGDNMLGFGGVEGAGTVKPSLEEERRAAATRASTPGAKRARPGAVAAPSGALSTDTISSKYSLADLDISAVTPDRVAALAPPLKLSDLKFQSYGDWLKQHRDVFGTTCDHEAIPRSYAPRPGSGLGGVAAAAAALGIVTSDSSSDSAGAGHGGASGKRVKQDTAAAPNCAVS